MIKNLTNSEISKKLKKIGFEAKTDIIGNYELYPSYDLETLIEALPSVIKMEGSGNNIYFKMNKNRVWYENSCNCDSSEYCPVNIYYRIDRQKNESLADTAGKMLIKLYEAGIINFKK